MTEPACGPWSCAPQRPAGRTDRARRLPRADVRRSARRGADSGGHWALEVDDLDAAFALLSAAPGQPVSSPASAAEPDARFAYRTIQSCSHLASLWTCRAVGRQRSRASASRQVGAGIRAVVGRGCAASCGLVLRARRIAAAVMSGGIPPPGSSGRRRCRREQPRSRTAPPRRRPTAAASVAMPESGGTAHVSRSRTVHLRYDRPSPRPSAGSRAAGSAMVDVGYGCVLTVFIGSRRYARARPR